MSSLSEIFLMHLKATSLQESCSEISIVQDNAHSSSNSLSMSFRDSSSRCSLDASDRSLNSAMCNSNTRSLTRSCSRRTRRGGRRPPSRNRSCSSTCSSSRWESVETVCGRACRDSSRREKQDDIPLFIPMRQDSDEDLMSSSNLEDDELDMSISLNDGSESVNGADSVDSRRSRGDSRPSLPRRQNSSQNLAQNLGGMSLPRIPRRLNSTENTSMESREQQMGRRLPSGRRITRRVKTSPTSLGRMKEGHLVSTTVQ